MMVVDNILSGLDEQLVECSKCGKVELFNDFSASKYYIRQMGEGPRFIITYVDENVDIMDVSLVREEAIQHAKNRRMYWYCSDEHGGCGKWIGNKDKDWYRLRDSFLLFVENNYGDKV